MKFLVTIEPGTDDTAWGVAVPALPDCFSAGDTLDEALENVKEAIEMQIEWLLDHDQPIPVGHGNELAAAVRADPDRAGWLLAVVDIAPEVLDATMERVNISLPRRVLYAIDRAATGAGKTRSGYLAEAALKMAADHDAASRD